VSGPALDLGLLRAVALGLPLGTLVLALAIRPPGRRGLAAVVVTTALALPAVTAGAWAGVELEAWRFEAEGGLLRGIPVDVLIGLAILWGPLPALLAPRLPLPALGVLALWLDLLLLPQVAPLIQVGPRWLAAELIGVGLVLLPIAAVGRWTLEDRRLEARAVAQAIAFGGLFFGLLPEAVWAHGGSGGWAALRDRPYGLVSIQLQLVAVIAALGVSAAQELVRRGRGTALPLDPTRRLVVSGLYAYVANPMQLALVLALPAWALVLDTPALALGGPAALVFGAGFAGWQEGGDLERRFGEPWRAYRAAVRPWWPRWRPWVPAPSRLVYAGDCDTCRALAAWFERRRPVGLALEGPPDPEAGGQLRLRYVGADGHVEEGVAALARGLEHLQLGWALVGAGLRLPILSAVAQVFADASGAAPRGPARPRLPPRPGRP
jgi:protein-S-isoprenylcysteine O-methyltransferase Ste14